MSLFGCFKELKLDVSSIKHCTMPPSQERRRHTNTLTSSCMPVFVNGVDICAVVQVMPLPATAPYPVLQSTYSPLSPVSSHVSRPELLIFGTFAIWGWIILSCEGCLVLCRIFSGISSLDLLDDSSPSSSDNHKGLQTLANDRERQDYPLFLLHVRATCLECYQFYMNHFYPS